MCFIFLDLLLGTKNLLLIDLLNHTIDFSVILFYLFPAYELSLVMISFNIFISSCHIISMISLNKGIQFTRDSALILRMLTSIREFERSTFKFWQLVMSDVQTGKLHPTSHSEISSRQYNHECQTERKEWKIKSYVFWQFSFHFVSIENHWRHKFEFMNNSFCTNDKPCLYHT